MSRMQGARSEANPRRYVSDAQRSSRPKVCLPEGAACFWAATLEYFSNVAEATRRKIFVRFASKSGSQNLQYLDVTQ